jgi:hypothetical protein
MALHVPNAVAFILGDHRQLADAVAAHIAAEINHVQADAIRLQFFKRHVAIRPADRELAGTADPEAGRQTRLNLSSPVPASSAFPSVFQWDRVCGTCLRNWSLKWPFTATPE